MLLTQVALIYKVERFYHNRYRIQACEKILKSSLFCPENEDEDAMIVEAMIRSMVFIVSFQILSLSAIVIWMILPFLVDEIRLPIAAR